MKDEQVGVITLVVVSFILHLVFIWFTQIPLNFFEIYGIIVFIISSYIAFIKPNQTK